MSFHTFIAGALSEKHIISEEELLLEVGGDYKSVYPIINALPEMNVHFIPELILEQVLSYPYGGEVIENNSSIVNNLLSLRMNDEITPEGLQSLIETEGLEERIFHHLGTKTWFWKVEIANKRTAVEAIIVCIPAAGSNTAGSGMEQDYSYRLYSFNKRTDVL